MAPVVSPRSTGDDGKDYFVHRGALAATVDFERLASGKKVEFDPQVSERGPRAINVRLA